MYVSLSPGPAFRLFKAWVTGIFRLFPLMTAPAWLGIWGASPNLLNPLTESPPCLEIVTAGEMDAAGFPLLQLDDCPQPVTDQTADNRQLLLPDLRTLPPSDLKIVTLGNGTRELRLSNMIWNSGEGALELEGSHDPAVRITRVVQYISSAQSDEKDSRPVGEFIWHAKHDHWHFEEFSVYELWLIEPDGHLGQLVSSSQKLSYCVIDTDVVDREASGFVPHRRYWGCGRTLQGLSVGWGDTYESFLDGQSISLRGIEDGVYALKSTVNPGRILLETNYLNNSAVVYLEIQAKEITVINIGEYFYQRCLEPGQQLVRSVFCWQ